MTARASKEGFLVVLCTCPDGDRANTIARRLVDQDLAACVNTLPGVKSTYRWQGEIETASEHLLLIKTRSGLYAELERQIRALHPYDLPEVIALPIVDGSEDYLAWLGASLRPPPKDH